MSKDSEWYARFFDDARVIFDLLSPRRSDAEARYIIRKTRLKRGMSFLDCPCGIGRVSIPLAKKGLRVTGVDLTRSYLEELNQKSARLHLRITTVRNDMRRIAYRNAFDAAGNLWTSFGYFEKESDNLLVLKKLHEALKRGGCLALHIINRDWILKHYTPSDVTRIGNVLVLDERTFNYRTSVNHGVWTFIRDNHRVTHACNLRLYSFHELVAMLEKAGFVDIEGFGSIKDEPIDRDHMMMWIFARKQKQRRIK